MNASRSSRSETRQSFSSGWIGMVKKPRFIENSPSFRPSAARAGIHNHDPHNKRNDEQNRTCGGYGFGLAAARRRGMTAPTTFHIMQYRATHRYVPPIRTPPQAPRPFE